MISPALRLMKDLSVAEFWQRAGRSDSGARENKFYRFASACVQRNGAHPDLLEPRFWIPSGLPIISGQYSDSFF